MRHPEAVQTSLQLRHHVADVAFHCELERVGAEVVRHGQHAIHAADFDAATWADHSRQQLMRGLDIFDHYVGVGFDGNPVLRVVLEQARSGREEVVPAQ